MKRTLVFGLVMLLVASGLGMFMTPASAAEEPLNLMVSNVTETSFTLSWTTENAVTGHVVIGAANFYDVRGSGYAGTTHYVEIGGRSPNTPYTFTVHSDGTAYSATLPFNQVTTLVMSPLPPMSHAVYGKVFEVDGTTPAEDTIVYMESATSEFEPISALTDANGEYFMNLGDIRKDDGSYYFDGTDFSAEITAQGGALGSITATRTLGASSPPEEIGDITLYAIDISIVAGDISIQTTPVYATVANQVTARVRNVGLYLAEDITVSFYEDDVLIGTPQLIASIPHTGTSYADVSVAWTPAAESPGVDIKVVVEPAPGVVDLNMANNEATKTGVVVLPAPAPDMSIVTADISFSPASPGGGDDVDITAIVRNLGNANGTVDVKFWRGSVGGTLIGEVLGVQVNRTAPTFRTVKILDWTIPVGNNIVFVELANVNPADSNPANNVANKSIYANPPEPDLQIWSNGITFTPTSPVVDSAVTITAKVLNNGTTIASCDVNFWEGASGSGTLLHTAHLASVAGMGHANAVYSGWLIPPGTTTITVEVFNSTPAEILLDNNEASKTITSRQPDLSIVAGDITFLPQGTDEDADFEMRAVIRNLGNAPGEGTVTFHTGTSAGPILAGPTPIPSIAAGGSTTITEVGFLPNPGDVKIYVVITDVTPTETSAANNIAFKTQTVYAVGPVVTYQ
ncbi:MAG: CARDB domain-containing protein [Candidatus Thermoplasmatota archaeon]|nr:CARDB domain-containing protein [Candidatus Thermoplasmatota archaeon]